MLHAGFGDKLVKIIFVVISSLCLVGCSTTQLMRTDGKYRSLQRGQEIAITLDSGEVVASKFRSYDGAAIKTDAGDFPVQSVESVTATVANTGGTFVLVLVAVVGIIAIAQRKVGKALCEGMTPDGADCD